MGEQHISVKEIDTPGILIDLAILDRNLQATAELARKAGVKLRPHFKTHKSIWIAKKQIEYGASGLTVAKLGEAEVLVAAGFTDILVAFPIVGEIKLQRLAKLMEKAQIIVSIDDVAVAKGLSELGVRIGRKVLLYIDVNSGLNRAGKEPGEETAALVIEIAALPGVEVRGLMTHGGHSYGKTTPEGLREIAKQEAESLVQTKVLLEKSGVQISEISVGSTPTSKFIGEQIGVTEMRPGAYVFGDISQIAIGIIGVEDAAMSVLATVVSTPRDGTALIDAGSKTFSSDTSAHRPGYGFWKANPEVYVERVNEEHGYLRLPPGMHLNIGDRLEIVPNHCCAVTNLHDHLYGVRDGMAVQDIAVDARGKIV